MANIGALIGLNGFVGKFRKSHPAISQFDNPTSAPSVSREDTVILAQFCLDRLASASLRAATTGKEVVVTAPNAETAAILKEVLRKTSLARPTDRLIRLDILSSERN